MSGESFKNSMSWTRTSMSHRLVTLDRSLACDTKANRLDLALKSSSGGNIHRLPKGIRWCEKCCQRNPLGKGRWEWQPWRMHFLGRQQLSWDQHYENKMDTLSSWTGKTFWAEETHMHKYRGNITFSKAAERRSVWLDHCFHSSQHHS